MPVTFSSVSIFTTPSPEWVYVCLPLRIGTRRGQRNSSVVIDVIFMKCSPVSLIPSLYARVDPPLRLADCSPGRRKPLDSLVDQKVAWLKPQVSTPCRLVHQPSCLD